MILITGGFGKLGNSLVKEIKNKKIFFIKRGNKYKKIAHNVVSLNLNNKNHLKKLFKSYKFSTLIHLAVTRNPLKIKNIRDTSTLIKDTNISINFLNEMRNIKKIILASSVSIFKLRSLTDKIDRRLIIKDINKFLNNNNNKIIIKSYFKKKRKKLINIDPLFHSNKNMRLNGSNKLINEILFVNYALENKIKIMIIRPSTIIETKKERKELQIKLNKYKKLN